MKNITDIRIIEADEWDMMEEEPEAQDSGEWETLFSEIRKLFKNAGFDIEVDKVVPDILIYVFLEDWDKIQNVLKLFSIASKLERDLLADYAGSAELYRTKQGYPVMCLTYYKGKVWDDEDLDFEEIPFEEIPFDEELPKAPF